MFIVGFIFSPHQGCSLPDAGSVTVLTTLGSRDWFFIVGGAGFLSPPPCLPPLYSLSEHFLLCLSTSKKEKKQKQVNMYKFLRSCANIKMRSLRVYDFKMLTF